MAFQSESYTGTSNTQEEFEKNLQLQLESIKNIQQQQTNLYSKLEVLGASKNISNQDVQNQINDILKTDGFIFPM